MTASGDGIQWTSGDAAKEIVGLPDGTYTLQETGDEFTANGKTYQVVTDTLTFVLEEGNVMNVTGSSDTAVKDTFDQTANKGYFYYNGDSDTNQNYIAV